MTSLIRAIAWSVLLSTGLPALAQTTAADAPPAAPAAALSVAPAPSLNTGQPSGSQAVVPGSVFANNTSAKPVSGPSFAPMGYALGFVLLLIGAAVWLLRRSGLAPMARNSQILSVVGQLPLGPRERVVVVEIEGRWLVVGVGPSGMARLASLPKGSPLRDATPPSPIGLQVPTSFAALVERLRRSGS